MTLTDALDYLLRKIFLKPTLIINKFRKEQIETKPTMGKSNSTPNKHEDGGQAVEEVYQ